MVTSCNIKKGPSSDKLVPFDSVEIADKIVNAAQLRAFLKGTGTMADDDMFLNKDNFPLNKASEPRMKWMDLLVQKVITFNL